MNHYVAPWNENKQLIRAALARAAEYFDRDGGCTPSLVDETIANRARLLVVAVNSLPAEIQPPGWIVVEDPHAEVAYKKGQLEVLNKLLTDRANEVHAERALGRKFTVTWDHDYLRLWCVDCYSDGTTVVAFAGNLADVGKVQAAMRTHRAQVHGETS